MLNKEFTKIAELMESLELLNVPTIELLAPHSPIAVVVISIIFIWSLGRLFSNEHDTLGYTDARSEADTDSSLALSLGLHIDGLTASKLEKLQNLIERKDTLRLAIFFATHQPTVREIEALFKGMQDQQLPQYEHVMINFIVDSKNILNDLQSETLRLLNENDICSILAHNKKKQKLIDKNFIHKFGNLLFMENFIMYSHLCRANPAIFHIPHENELRHMYDTFVKTGLATQGTSIPLENRLHILNKQQLQAIATEVGVNRSFNTVHEAAVALSTVPMTTTHLEKKFPCNELFLLKQENWDIDAVEQEWSAYNVYAKLLCAMPE